MRVSGATPSPAPQATLPNDPAKAAKAFEGWFIGFLAEQMQDSIGGGPLSGGAADVFSDYFTQEIGRRASEGRGIGLADQVREALERSAARDSSAFAGQGVDLGAQHGLHHVAPEGHRVTSGFGLRTDPIEGGTRRHDGIDLAARTGTPIMAARDGVVRFAGKRGGYGNVVVLDHGDGVETRYAHCDTLGVKAGQVVRAGESLATVGSTGRSTGPHLHFELRSDGHAVDPQQDVTKVLGRIGQPESYGIRDGTSSTERQP
jgi:murein DD-endopeptidase MepM/ murein hydrolase activator NlpD